MGILGRIFGILLIIAMCSVVVVGTMEEHKKALFEKRVEKAQLEILCKPYGGVFDHKEYECIEGVVFTKHALREVTSLWIIQIRKQEAERRKDISYE